MVPITYIGERGTGPWPSAFVWGSVGDFLIVLSDSGIETFSYMLRADAGEDAEAGDLISIPQDFVYDEVRAAVPPEVRDAVLMLVALNGWR